VTSHSNQTVDSLPGRVREKTGLNPAACYQCGKCTAGCPMSAEMPLPVHQIIRLVQLDARTEVLESESIWLCLTCETCTTRCPNGFDPARLVDALREMALAGRSEPPGTIRAFHDAFLGQIRRHGRVHEVGLVAGFKLGGGPLFQDVAAAPGMLARGKLGFVPQRVSAIDEIRRIFDACRPGEDKS
jgi:heterodisulfide reductase subunit C2